MFCVKIDKMIYFSLISDYLRIVFAFVSFYYMPTDYLKASFFYLLSGFLDAFDGHFARMLNQGNDFFFLPQRGDIKWVSV